MKELLHYIVERIVNNPEEVKIETEEINDTLNLKLKVAPEDMGLIIGKNGSTIQSLRNLLKTKAIKDDIRFNLELMESPTSEEE
ncbi:MAG: KH domain-containing protein [Patescibacteria group bacterium]|nr:KH domain-containing protein [Patescibacteria group bacterium]